MNSELTTSFPVEDVGMGGKLTIQSDYQRNYIYGDGVI